MKLLMKKELENFYNLRKGEPVGVLGSVYATSAEAVGVSEVGDDYVISVKHCDSENINIFVVSKEEIDDKGVITLKGQDTELYVSTAISDFIIPKDEKEEYLIFLDPSMHKGFSKWLFDLESDIYIAMTEENVAYLPNAVFRYTFNVKQWNNYLFYNRLTYIEGSKSVNLRLNHDVPGNSLTMQFLKSIPEGIYSRDDDGLVPLGQVEIRHDYNYRIVSELGEITVEEDNDIFDDFIEEISDNEQYRDAISITVRFDTER